MVHKTDDDDMNQVSTAATSELQTNTEDNNNSICEQHSTDDKYEDILVSKI